MKDGECTIEVYMIGERWNYQIETSQEAITPRNRTFGTALSAKRAAAMAADRLRLTVKEINNLEVPQ